MGGLNLVQQTKKYVPGSLPGSRCQGYRFVGRNSLKQEPVGRVQAKYKLRTIANTVLLLNIMTKSQSWKH